MSLGVRSVVPPTISSIFGLSLSDNASNASCTCRDVKEVDQGMLKGLSQFARKYL